MNIPDEVIMEAVAAVDRHWVVEQLNLGYYRTETKCVCGAAWMSGDHEGDPDYHEQMERHRLSIAGPLIAEWARKEALRGAIEAIDSLDGSRATGYYASEAHSGYQEAQRDAEYAIQALAGGHKTDD